MPHDAHPMGVLVSAMSALSVFHPDANPALRVSNMRKCLSDTSSVVKVSMFFLYIIVSDAPLSHFDSLK